MKKRTKVLLIACCALICCIACVLLIEYMSRDYDLVKKDGKSYISLRSVKEEEESNTDNAYVSTAVFGPTFSSVAEMKNNILNGNLTEQELYAIRTCYAKDGLWEICDLDNLYDARLPDKTSIKQIALRGKSYSFTLENYIAVNCFIDHLDEADYNKAFEEEYLGFPNEFEEVIWEEQTEDRNATIKYFRTGAGVFKRLEYTLQQDDRMLYVIEEYTLSFYTGSKPTSDTIPRTVTVYGEENGGYYKVWVLEPIERPSVEWLTSFGLVPFEG